MDSFTMWQTPRERAEARDRRSFWDQWDEECEQINAIQSDALDLLHSLDTLREQTYRAKAVEDIDFFAADFAGTLHDLISNRIGQAQKRGDDLGLSVLNIDCETGIFTEEVDRWLARAKARRTEIVYMTAADLGLAP